MTFLKKILRNLALLVGIGIILYILYPDMMSQVFELYWGLFGPVAVLVLIVAALPRGKG